MKPTRRISSSTEVVRNRSVQRHMPASMPSLTWMRQSIPLSPQKLKSLWWQTQWLSHPVCFSLHCVSSRRTTTAVESLMLVAGQDSRLIGSRPKPRLQQLSLETSRDQDSSLENYITDKLYIHLEEQEMIANECCIECLLAGCRTKLKVTSRISLKSWSSARSTRFHHCQAKPRADINI